ncbi:MAG: hypothetical protein ACFFB3_12725, partial [Candidatus Hodarchaeota archaeon]
HLGLGTALFGLSVLNAAVCIQKKKEQRDLLLIDPIPSHQYYFYSSVGQFDLREAKNMNTSFRSGKILCNPVLLYP